jgi:hypothetical protein
MAQIVRFKWSPPGSPVGYGYLGAHHPTLRAYRFVHFLSPRTPLGLPGAYYSLSQLNLIGTAFIE